jgi:5-methylcytosine-specific restriction endonuclease McrA
MVKAFDKSDFWRAIILYGFNEATYKIALGQCLIRFTEQDKTFISMNDLAKEFFDLYHERLKSNKPQLATPHRRTVMERIIDLYNLGSITKEKAIEKVEIEAFRDVVPRFHNVNYSVIPVKFYEHSTRGLTLSDNLFNIFKSSEKESLTLETLSRWDLLEAAFMIRRNNHELCNDVRRLYLSKGYDRSDVTGTIPVLNGYQNGICFYCGDVMAKNDMNVDHVIPRQLIYHDDIWNLVISHEICNIQKSDALPDISYIEKLTLRNEHFIISNHPIKEKLIRQLGNTPILRRNFINNVYKDARLVIGYTWRVKGYNPASDKFFETFIKNVAL